MATNTRELLPRDQRALRSAVDRLCTATLEGDTAEFVRLLKKEIPSLHDAFNSDGLSPLHVSVMARGRHHRWHRMSCTLLFHRDRLRLDINIRSRNCDMPGWTALDFACAFRNARAVRTLQHYGCEAYDMTYGRLGGYNHRRRLQFDMEMAKIRAIAFPSPAHPPVVEFSDPHSITPAELCCQLQHSDPSLVNFLVHRDAIFPYHPVSSSDTINYCFPAYFPEDLPKDKWTEAENYTVYIGRFLTPLTDERDIWRIFLQLLIRVMSDIDDKPAVSQSVFCFQTPIHTQCHVSVREQCSSGAQITTNGLQLLVRSNESLQVSLGDVPEICEYLVHTTQALSGGTLSVGVVSSMDLRSGKPNPHVYTSAEVKAAKNVLLHPSGIEESFLSLLLEQTPANRAAFPCYLTAYRCAQIQQYCAIELARGEEKAYWTDKRRDHYPAEYTWSREVCHEAVFTVCYQDLIVHLSPEYLVPPLVTARYLSAQEVESIVNPCSAPRLRSMFLLARLDRRLREERDYYEFFTILREEEEHHGHRELERRLIEACNSIKARQQEAAVCQVSLTPCIYHQHPREEDHHSDWGSPVPPDSNQPLHDASYSSWDRSTRADTGVASSFEYTDSRELSFTPSNTHCTSTADSGHHSRPSTGGRGAQRVQVLRAQSAKINRPATDFSKVICPSRFPPTIAPAQLPQSATSTAATHCTKDDVSVEGSPHRSSDESSSDGSSPFSLSTESNHSTDSAASVPLCDDIIRSRFAQVLTHILLLLVRLVGPVEEDNGLLPGLGQRM